MVWFHSFEVVAELFPGDLSIIISIVRVFEELFNIDNKNMKSKYICFLDMIIFIFIYYIKFFFII